jgi:hypothetical protein
MVYVGLEKVRMTTVSVGGGGGGGGGLNKGASFEKKKPQKERI